MSGHVMFCSTEKENICTHCIGFFFSPNKIARDVNDDISYLRRQLEKRKIRMSKKGEDQTREKI